MGSVRIYATIISMSILTFFAGLCIGYIIGIGSSTIPEKVIVYKTLEYRSIEFPVVAVSSNGEGVLEHATLKLIPGSGRAYIKLNPFVETDTQYSFETAVKVACKLAKVNCKYYDFILEFHTNATLVGGPSAGAAMTLAAYLLLKNETFPKDIAITGTISEDGTIGPVGGVFEKALAAAKQGKKYFFVPLGQSVVMRYEKIEKRKEIGPFVFIQIYYRPVPFNLTEYFEQNYGMKVIEVSNIKELINYVEK